MPALPWPAPDLSRVAPAHHENPQPALLALEKARTFFLTDPEAHHTLVPLSETQTPNPRPTTTSFLSG